MEKFYTLIHLINKYRNVGPYIAANTYITKRLYNFNPENEVLDKYLLKQTNYFSPEGISLLFQRHFAGLLLNYDECTEVE